MDLKAAQDDAIIVVKKVDKGGGIAILGAQDYYAEIMSQLQAKTDDGRPFYEPACENYIKDQVKRIQESTEAGHKNGFISDSATR